MIEPGLAQTLDAIYDVALAPERWPALLQRLGQEFRCHFAGMVASNVDRSVYRGMALGVDRDAHQRFLSRFHQPSPLRLAAPPRVAGQILEIRDIMSRPLFERTEMYQEFYRPHDMGEGLGLTIWQGKTGTQTVSLVRSWAKGPFDAAEHARARALMPHLRRMAEVTRRLLGADLLARSAYQALSAVPQPVLLLDHAAHLVHANAAAEALLQTADGLAYRRGGLVGATAAATRQLETLIGACALRPGSGGTMRLPRASGKPALALLAIPMRGLDDFMLAGRPAILVCVSDPAQQREAQPAMLMTLFGLTRAEAALATRLLAGEELSTIAAATGRSIATVRNLLARLMAKTETRRQTDLVRMLDRLPHPPPSD